MNEDLKQRLITELGLSAEQADKLAAEGIKEAADMALLNAEQIKTVTGCTLLASIKIQNAFAPAPHSAPLENVIAPEDGADAKPPKPTPGEVSSFASGLGIDPAMLTMVLMGNMSAGTGMEMDLSSMMPIPGIVSGYNPKLRNIPYMVMGQIENRLRTPIVVINADGSVNSDLTVKYIMTLEEGFPPAENDVFYDDGGLPYQVIAVGVDAQSIFDADPLLPTNALQKSGMGVGRVNWKGTSLDVRQVAFYAATQTGELSYESDANLTWLRDHIKPGVNYLVFQGQAPKAITAYNQALRTGSLPTLRVMLNRTARKPEVMPRRRMTTPRDLAGIGARRDGEL
jgi:hypothetical protein